MFAHTRSSSTSKIEYQYEPFLKNVENESSEENIRYLRPENYVPTSKFLISLITFLATSFIWVSIFFLTHPSRKDQPITDPGSLGRHNITNGAKLLECGNSTEEAKSRNCQYDVLMNSWIPAPCIDQDYIDEYLDDNSWTAFRDEAMTQPLESIEEISEVEVYYTSLRDHINHCAMIWKKQFWVLYTERSAFDTIIANSGHTDHCATFLTETLDIDLKQATKVEKEFAGCWLRNQN